MKAYGQEIKEFLETLPENASVEGALKSYEIELAELDDFTLYDFEEIGCEEIYPDGYGGESDRAVPFATEFRKWKKTKTYSSVIVTVSKHEMDYLMSSVKNLKIKGLTMKRM